MRVPGWRSSAWDDEVYKVLNCYNGDPYKPVENDCWSFVARVLSDLYRIKKPILPVVHISVTGAKRIQAERAFLSAFPQGHFVPMPVYLIESGDVLVRETHKAIHVMLAGTRRGEIWHCTEDHGVCQKGWEKVDRVYRLENKHDWV